MILERELFQIFLEAGVPLQDLSKSANALIKLFSFAEQGEDRGTLMNEQALLVDDDGVEPSGISAFRHSKAIDEVLRLW